MPGPYVRTFWTVEGKADKDGHPIEFPTEAAARAQSSAGGIAGTGIGAGLGPVPAATPPVKVTEVMTEDGEYVQTVEGPDGQPQEIARGVDKARMDLYKTRQAASPTADTTPKTITAADGSVWQYDPSVTDADVSKRWKMVTPPKAEAEATKPTEVGGKLVKVDPKTGKAEVVYEPPTKRTAPEFSPGAPRAGQKTDLASVKLQYDLFAQQLAAEPNITQEEYNRRLSAYIAANVTPAVERAAQEVRDEAERAQREKDAATARTTAREARLDTAAEQTEARSYAEFQQRAGQNAVSNALALLPYQHNPLFLKQYAAGLNTLAGGGGVVNFTPEAFQVPLPDLTALADQGAQRAAALYHAAGGVPLAPRTPGAVASPNAALAGVPMALPPPRPSMPGAPGAPAPFPQAPFPPDPGMLPNPLGRPLPV